VGRITVTDLLEAGVHFGHQTRRWNPKMKPYIYGVRNGISIFDLTVTLRQLGRTCDFLRETAANGGSVLFVGTKRQAQETVRNAAEETGMFYMCHRWLGGTLTNNRVVLSRVNYMRKLQRMEAEGALNEMLKKEAAGLRRELAKLQRYLGGIANMRKLPAAMVVVDTLREDIAIREANKLGIPVVAIVDSNSDPDPIDYVVPGNDDAVRAIKVIIDVFAAAIAEGKGIRLKKTPDAEAAEAETPPADPIAVPSVEPAAPGSASAEEAVSPPEPASAAQPAAKTAGSPPPQGSEATKPAEPPENDAGAEEPQPAEENQPDEAAEPDDTAAEKSDAE